jgi:V/A-type H+/Na+-transporting ATPase subunit D
MTRLHRVPPGRGGRLWLQHRLTVAATGASLLDQKLRILHAEARRLALAAGRTATTWEETIREADTWLLRAALLGGERAVRLAEVGGEADVSISWALTMGVRYPMEATCRVPAPPPDAVPPTSAAVVAARRACEAALDAAVQHAVAEAAARVLAAEESATRRRLRAINERWIPLLTTALTEARQVLEQQEREDDIRLRWAHTARSATAAGVSEEPSHRRS